jgi:hypothetical protein
VRLFILLLTTNTNTGPPQMQALHHEGLCALCALCGD